MEALTIATAFTYAAYREKVSQDLQYKLTHTPDDALLPYTQLNETRMNRLDKTIVLTDEVRAKLQQLKQKYTFYVISEGWCGDAAQLLPVINKLVEGTDAIQLKIIFRDDNLDIMNQYLTNGSQSIPKLIILDDKDDEVAVWGPRPVPATELIQENKKQFGKVTDEGKAALQVWYNKDKGETTQKEIVALLK
ncbi:thioredoxin family protein [Flavobacterium agricola]|uniref:Thioredoxin family protein n=1 Tax=Flavobacterium agricola TaxID=2870839 RepID=A0ABY6M1Z5_9FLAO|nr:thioredoxin family protein [Flavobacterium agricola]UYW01258.1 thioredoxin family protein [Flavobacterium agricola]